MDVGIGLNITGRLFDMKKHHNNQGSTMVEVLVGFAILMILMAGIARIINVSSNMLYSTRDMLDEQESFVEEFYKNNHGSLNAEEITSFTVSLEETDDTGNMKSGGITLDLDHANPEKVYDGTVFTVYQFE
jgi:hypothetical protein